MPFRKWEQTWMMQFHPLTCQGVRVTNKTGQQTETYLCLLHEGTLEKVKSAKYIGLNVDNKLNFNTHFHDYAVEKANATLIFLGPRRPLWDPSLNTHLPQGYYPDIYSAQEKWQEAGQKISSALNRLALEIPLDLYCVVFSNIKEHTWEWVQLQIINTLCRYRLTFQSVIFKIYSITRISPTLKLRLSFRTNFLSNFLKGTTR